MAAPLVTCKAAVDIENPPEGDDTEWDQEAIPILVRSLSTSRRHSWGVPLSPFDPERRLSLDTTAMGSDVGREEDRPPQSAEIFLYPLFPTESSEERNGPSKRDSSRSKQKKEESESDQSVKSLHSRSETLMSEMCQSARDRIVPETSKPAARVAGAEKDLEDNLHVTEGQSHVAKHSEDKESSVTWYEFLSNEIEEEEDKAEKEERVAVVKRTLSCLRNRMTGSFNKDKGKSREREQQPEKGREKEKEREPSKKEKFSRSSSDHQLVAGSFSSCATCSLCSKSLQRKQGLQCLNCAVNVHKSCRNLLAECNSRKNKLKGSLRRSTGAVESTAWEFPTQARSLADGPPGMTITPRRLSLQSLAPASASVSRNSSSRSIPGDMEEADGVRSKTLLDDSVSLAPSTAEPILLEDAHYAALRADLESDAQDFEPESWSLAVDQQYSKKHHKEAIKRQDVIYELIQTEVHHMRTLKIMSRVYAHKLQEALQMDERKVERLFPRLESLLEVHRHFLSRLKERRLQFLEPNSERNYCILRLGDILVSQFSGENGDKIKECYGEFCSRQAEAVSYYKDQLQNNKKFQSLIRKVNNLSIVRRLGVPECILLVTQRIMKYPVLVERILQNVDAGTEECEELTQALALIKDTITQVDACVNDYEKAMRQKDIANKMEPKSSGKRKDGSIFRKEDVASARRKLLHEGTLNWKAASGRLKDILAVLLSDVLLLLQEKDQKYTFATVDNKPSVISLQKLIVREVAHEEKAMFLICASAAEPEMYEIHATSKEERSTWITLIRQAAESCPHTEEGLVTEQEEARASRLRDFQEHLRLKDAQITESLREKLQIFAEFAEMVPGLENIGSRTQLMLRGDSSDLQQGELLLKGAITEAEHLQDLLLSGMKDSTLQSEGGQDSTGPPRRADTFGGFDSGPSIIKKSASMKKRRSRRASSDPQLRPHENLEQNRVRLADEPSSAVLNPVLSSTFPETEFLDRVLMLSQRLYSLQAIISLQDSHMDLQRASLTEQGRWGRPRGDGLLGHEKQRNLERQREEQASFHRLQNRHQQEQARWERERERQRQEAEEEEARLRAREEDCRRLEKRLAEERQELGRQRELYQQDLERMREANRAVERDREWLGRQRKQRGALALEPAQDLPLSSSFNEEILTANASGSLAPGSKLPGRSAQPADSLPVQLFSTTNQQHKPVGVQQQIPTKLAVLSKGKERGRRVKGSHRHDSSASIDIKQILPLKLTGKEEGSLRGKRTVSPPQRLQNPAKPDLSSPQRLQNPAKPDPSSPQRLQNLAKPDLCSPHLPQHPVPVSPPDSYSNAQPAYVGNPHKPISQSALPTKPLPFKITEDATKEEVIFF